MSKKHTQKYRDRVRANGGVVVYATITDPQAVEAWNKLQEVYGSNRAVVEACLINEWEQLKDE